LHGKENGVRHQIRFHFVAIASLHQANLRCFHRRRLVFTTDIFQTAITVGFGGSVHR
jgi:hypothetical protein